jgi:phosphonate transport system ATP-binding protein
VDEPTASLDPKTSRQVMRLIVELVEERNLRCIINIHDVILAKQFSQRIIGLQEGKIVFEGKSDELDISVLNTIYGEEDWNIKKNSPQDEEDGPDILSMGN